MNIVTLIDELTKQDIRLSIKGEKLLIDAPKGVLTDTLTEVLRRRKPEIVATLKAANDPDHPVTSWGWRIVHQDGSEVESFFSPHVTRDQALKLTPGAVNAEPIDNQRTDTRKELADDLRRMIQAMGEHWHYSDGDYATAYKGARSDPDQWRALCAEDSKRFGWQVPKALTPGELEQAVAEAVAERRAILEHEARLSAERADAVTKLATVFYRHVFGVAHETGCCKPRSGSYCVEGLRLRDEYYEVAS